MLHYCLAVNRHCERARRERAVRRVAAAVEVMDQDSDIAIGGDALEFQRVAPRRHHQHIPKHGICLQSKVHRA